MPVIRRTSDDALGARRSIRLSPSSIHVLESCKAGWIYTRQLLPKTTLDEQESITSTGSLFHSYAEQDFVIDSLQARQHIDDGAMNEILEFAEVVKSRGYYKYPAQKELKIEFHIPGSEKKWMINGYVDRRCTTDNGNVIIVDYKTSWMSDLAKDKRQLLTYGYIEHNTNNTEPHNIIVTIDYVRTKEEFSVTLTPKDIEMTEERLLRSFRTAEDLLDEMEKPDFDMSRVAHSPTSGVCNICPMKGMCMAYRVVVNAEIPKLGIDATSSESLYAELGDRLEAVNINDARADAIKRALMLRLKNGDPYLQKIHKEKKIIVSPMRTIVYRDELIRKILPGIVKKAIKNIRFNDMIDTTVIASRIEELITALIPKSLAIKDIPADYKEDSLDLRREIPTSQYLKYKKLTKETTAAPVQTDEDDGII